MLNFNIVLVSGYECLNKIFNLSKKKNLTSICNKRKKKIPF